MPTVSSMEPSSASFVLRGSAGEGGSGRAQAVVDVPGSGRLRARLLGRLCRGLKRLTQRALGLAPLGGELLHVRACLLSVRVGVGEGVGVGIGVGVGVGVGLR